MIVTTIAAALAAIATPGGTAKNVTYDVTDYVVTDGRTQASDIAGTARTEGEIETMVSLRTGGSDVTFREGDMTDGRPFRGTRIDIGHDGRIVLTNSRHDRTATAELTVDDEGMARATYVVIDGGRRRTHLVTVLRRG